MGYVNHSLYIILRDCMIVWMNVKHVQIFLLGAALRQVWWLIRCLSEPILLPLLFFTVAGSADVIFYREIYFSGFFSQFENLSICILENLGLYFLLNFK